MKEILNEEVKVGDYAYIDGCSSFCTGYYARITAIKTRYDETTGKPYDVVICGDQEYVKDTGLVIKGATAYSVFGYYTEEDSEIEMRKLRKSLRLKRSALIKRIQKDVLAALDEINATNVDKYSLKVEFCSSGISIRYDTPYDDKLAELDDKLGYID